MSAFGIMGTIVGLVAFFTVAANLGWWSPVEFDSTVYALSFNFNAR